jgi:hypothetical protein
MEQTKVDLVLKDEDDQWGFRGELLFRRLEYTLHETVNDKPLISAFDKFF